MHAPLPTWLVHKTPVHYRPSLAFADELFGGMQHVATLPYGDEPMPIRSWNSQGKKKQLAVKDVAIAG